jgi:hypothetical protein
MEARCGPVGYSKGSLPGLLSCRPRHADAAAPLDDDHSAWGGGRGHLRVSFGYCTPKAGLDALHRDHTVLRASRATRAQASAACSAVSHSSTILALRCRAKPTANGRLGSASGSGTMTAGHDPGSVAPVLEHQYVAVLIDAECTGIVARHEGVILSDRHRDLLHRCCRQRRCNGLHGHGPLNKEQGP